MVPKTRATSQHGQHATAQHVPQEPTVQPNTDVRQCRSGRTYYQSAHCVANRLSALAIRKDKRTIAVAQRTNMGAVRHLRRNVSLREDNW